MPFTRQDPEERFWSKVNKTETCWLWTSHQIRGYGRFWVDPKVHGPMSTLAHRWAYQWFVGPIPTGYQIDHLCRVTLCVRPDHLEAVTALENMRRVPFPPKGKPLIGTHCRHGHARAIHLRRAKNGRAYCAECNRIRVRAYNRARRAA